MFLSSIIVLTVIECKRQEGLIYCEWTQHILILERGRGSKSKANRKIQEQVWKNCGNKGTRGNPSREQGKKGPPGKPSALGAATADGPGRPNVIS